MALVIVFIFIVVLTILGAVVAARTISEKQLLQRNTESIQAFWLAEAAAGRASDELRKNPALSEGSNLFLTALAPGEYDFGLVKSAVGNTQVYTVTARGYIPSSAASGTLACRVTRSLIVVMQQLQTAPANFYDNAVYVSNNVSKGKTISGNVIFGGVNSSTATITNGAFIHDSSANPLALLNFEQLRTISQSQGHYNPDFASGNTWPSSFWQEAPSESNPFGTPAVAFVEGNFSIAGNTTRYGFIVVGGEFTYDATISGTSSIVGTVYTRGNFTINGGGNALNIDGGVWAGGSANLGGNGKIQYNAAYMNAIKNLGITTDVQVTSWQDTQNPYSL